MSGFMYAAEQHTAEIMFIYACSDANIKIIEAGAERVAGEILSPGSKIKSQFCDYPHAQIPLFFFVIEVKEKGIFRLVFQLDFFQNRTQLGKHISEKAVKEFYRAAFLKFIHQGVIRMFI